MFVDENFAVVTDSLDPHAPVVEHVPDLPAATRPEQVVDDQSGVVVIAVAVPFGRPPARCDRLREMRLRTDHRRPPMML
ncbi:hypothetical protein [Lentzea terrae]|uniref:hypothetical protein n=1 Tax=Lentzea terrae TaxID=2200761 RepID=UPI0013008A3F|nr:hypothetical protein [Lentzea terrae]